MRVWGPTVEAAHLEDVPPPLPLDPPSSSPGNPTDPPPPTPPPSSTPPMNRTSDDDDSDSESDPETDAPPPSPPKTRHPRVQAYLNRFLEAKIVYPLIFEEETSFWSTHPADAVYAPFPDNTITGTFVYPLKPLPDHPKPLTTTGKWLLSSLDIVDAPPPPDATISDDLRLRMDQLWRDEKDGLKAFGCKTGRDLTVLTLYSSEGRKPEGRTAFNPATDVSKGQCALVRMAEANDTPGQRGWDIVEVASQPEVVENKLRYKVCASSLAAYIYGARLLLSCYACR